MSAAILRQRERPGTERAARQTAFTVRDAQPSDNDGLVALARSCSMSGDIGLRVDRTPDFFALNRLEGDKWRLAVAERAGHIIGCICFSERRSYLDGAVQRTGYVGDLKVHPDHRNSVIADALCRYTASRMSELPEETPVLITVLAGNAAMERRLDGPRGLARFSRVATIRNHSLCILWKRPNPVHWANVSSAVWNDLGEMAELWRTVSSRRQLAPAYDLESLARWIREAPGLDITDFRLARARDGRLLGFLGLWDQRRFKQLTVTSYSKRMSVARRAFDVIARAVGGERLPSPGAAMNLVTATHVCVPHNRADILRSLLIESYNELRGSGCAVLNIGLDRIDPLSAALKGLLAQPTDVHAYLADARGKAWNRPLGGVLHCEVGLV